VTWAPDYVTSAELKGYAKIPDNADDAFIALWITTVSRNVDEFCGRQFGQTAAESRYYTPVYDRHERAWFAEVDDVQDVTGMTVADENGTVVTDYVLLPRNAAVKGRPYERLKLTACTGEIGVNVKWGWGAVPSAVKEGVFLQGNRLKARRVSPFGIAGSPTEGSEIRLLAQLDPDFRTSLKPLVRDWWAA
jgi:hypothetical protein